MVESSESLRTNDKCSSILDLCDYEDNNSPDSGSNNNSHVNRKKKKETVSSSKPTAAGNVKGIFFILLNVLSSWNVLSGHKHCSRGTSPDSYIRSHCGYKGGGTFCSFRPEPINVVPH